MCFPWANYGYCYSLRESKCLNGLDRSSWSIVLVWKITIDVNYHNNKKLNCSFGDAVSMCRWPNYIANYWPIQAGLLTTFTFARHLLSPLAAFTSGAYFLARKITKRIHSSKPASLNRPITKGHRCLCARKCWERIIGHACKTSCLHSILQYPPLI